MSISNTIRIYVILNTIIKIYLFIYTYVYHIKEKFIITYKRQKYILIFMPKVQLKKIIKILEQQNICLYYTP